MEDTMTEFRRYKKRRDAIVTAIRFDLQTEGFAYEKWGGMQRCKAGDWLLLNGEDTYTVDADVFAATYTCVGTGQYAKLEPVWAKASVVPGRIETIEGLTDYVAGDYIVFNDEARTEGWAVSKTKFEAMYELASDVED